LCLQVPKLALQVPLNFLIGRSPEIVTSVAARVLKVAVSGMHRAQIPPYVSASLHVVGGSGVAVVGRVGVYKLKGGIEQHCDGPVEEDAFPA